MKLLIRDNSHQGESLSSYMQRISKLNFVSSHDLWRLFKRYGAHYPQSSFSVAIDVCPNNIIELDKFASALELQESQLESLTFIPVFQKLGIPAENIANSRVLSNIIEKHRKFCPKCLEENLVYQLIWQVKEVSFCPIHKVELNAHCYLCKKSIPIIPSSSELGICPSCKWNLKNSASHIFNTDTSNARIIEDWTYLTHPIEVNFDSVYNFTNQQTLALRLLYLSEISCQEISEKERTTLASIMQIARNTKSLQTYIHLNTILHFVRKHNVSLESFFKLEVPENYISSIFQQKSRMIDNYSCIAPWCEHYNKPGSLKKTSTSIKRLKSGQELKYYMFCTDCGIEYGINKTDNKLVERGYFINLAWNQVKNRLIRGNTLCEISKETYSTEDKLRRSIIFLASNNIIDNHHVPIKIPSSQDPNIISYMKKYIKQGISVKHIQKLLSMNYNDFLYYWLSAEIRKVYMTNINRKRTYNNLSIEREHKFNNAVNTLFSEGKPICISSICNLLSICPETLRNWGFLNDLKRYKLIQKRQLDEEFRTSIVKKIDIIFSEVYANGEYISSEYVYKSIGIGRTVLVRKFPDITHYIHSKLVGYKKYIY